MDKGKLFKFALNKLDDAAEMKEVLDWIDSSEANKDEFETLKNLWAISGFGNYSTYLESTPKKQPGKIRRLLPVLQKYAAIFILAFAIGAALVYSLTHNTQSMAWNEIVVPDGESAEIYLSDSTHVWLNSGTRLIYPAYFAAETREVTLSGEAFFDVKRNNKQSFLVRTEHLNVKVLGTQFNVEAQQNSSNVNVTLVEGKVNLQNVDGKFLTTLVPGENASFDVLRKSLAISVVNTDFYTSWTKGFLMFNNETLEDIARKFERWYNVKVIFDDEAIKHIKYTGTIMKNKPIDQILNILKYTAGIEFSIEMKNNKPSIIHLKRKPM